jgi:hypothetical protein
MSKRGPRPVVFVCIGVGNNTETFISKIIQAVSQEEAASLFLEQTGVKAKTIHGPFRPKRAQVIENTRTLKFSDKKQEKAVYNDWEVNVLFLKEPENHAYLLFIKRVDGKKQPAPKGTIIVPVSNLRFNDE